MASPVEKYRAVQSRIRRYLDPYTIVVCPDCPLSCCLKPNKVTEFDVLLANACGCSLPSANESVSAMVSAGIDSIAGNADREEPLAPCDYLGPDGCIFPGDLRPYECTRYICSHLKRVIRPGDMRELRALLHRLSVIHRDLVQTVKPQSR